jgi:hypothetical protein
MSDEKKPSVAESLTVLGITSDSIAQAVSDHVWQLLQAGVWPGAIRMKVREHTRTELQWLERLIEEARHRREA